MNARINYYKTECASWVKDLKGEKTLREVAKSELETAKAVGDKVTMSEIVNSLRIARRALRNS